MIFTSIPDSSRLVFELTYAEWALVYSGLHDHITQLKMDIDSGSYPPSLVAEMRHELYEVSRLKDKILFEGKEVCSNAEA